MKEFLEKCGVFFTSPLFAIGSFQVVVWHVAAVVALLLVVIIIIICSAAKKRKNKLEVVEGEIVSATTATEEVASEPAVEQAPAEQQPAEPGVEEQPAAPVVEEEPAPAPAVEESAAPSQDVTIVEVEEEGDWEADATTEETAPAAEEATPSQPDKPRVKCYHISLREDGRWQVKLSKGARALKLFRTQAEAIAFAKEKAKNQEGYITIHKVSGKIRKQKY
ncbi:MAG: DUF2188 domain-containing protein [Clostridia bacterium]|nr:DUF2188 domain-containing protein [Clostridia bacterium]